MLTVLLKLERKKMFTVKMNSPIHPFACIVSFLMDVVTSRTLVTTFRVRLLMDGNTQIDCRIWAKYIRELRAVYDLIALCLPYCVSFFLNKIGTRNTLGEPGNYSMEVLQIQSQRLRATSADKIMVNLHRTSYKR